MKFLIQMLHAFVIIAMHANAYAQPWQGSWICHELPVDRMKENIWLGFKKEIVLEQPVRAAIARIAVDSKYWLYVNGQQVVFEGGLKRGPNSRDTYYDEVDLGPFLRKGSNTVAIKVWYFGRDGFSHNSSGQPGLLFDLQIEDKNYSSDASWLVKPLAAYQTMAGKVPNFRLPESNIQYDARLEDPHWFSAHHTAGFVSAKVIGPAGAAPWYALHRRPIPQWKDFGMKEILRENITRHGDTLLCKLPYNMQFTPYIVVEAPAGRKVELATDNYYYYNGSAEIIHAAYITREGKQAYESPGWMNGHYLYILAPDDVQIAHVGYRETGYATEFAGGFSCDDAFFNRLWEKARRTLYITMRDSYMDCPDRERAQWTGDAVLEAEEAFYALDTAAHALARKWLYELVNWQKEDGSMFAPVPAGNWDKELPDQVMASIGYYGMWTYYLHTGDRRLLEELYPRIQRYMDLWEFDNQGLVKLRAGGWQWGDWGENKDMLLLYNLWYYLGMKGNLLMAKELGRASDVAKYKAKMERMKAAFNTKFWHNGVYRDPNYKGETDDRVHALAVLSGIADSTKYGDIERVFATQEHASPYMEKYVFEAMYQMRLPEKANARHKKRFSNMVNSSYFTTLFEGWGIGAGGFGGGTVNHAWSGGGLTVLSAYAAGIRPLQPAYTQFAVDPQMGALHQLEVKVPTVKGDILAEMKRSAYQLEVRITVPEGTEALFHLSKDNAQALRVNKQSIHKAGKLNRAFAAKFGYTGNTITLPAGIWKVVQQFNPTR